jgi:DNA-binding NtrC family response regulator
MTGEKPPKKGKNQKEPSFDSHAILTLSHVTSEAEKVHIERTLKATKGNRTNTAELLGISRKTLWKKIKEYYIETE